MKRVLMIAAQYPPLKGSSGLQRVLKFSQYLPEHDWQPIMLTPADIAHEQTSDEQLAEIPGSVLVRKAPALDTKRHLSFLGRYPARLALPDRWASWWVGAVPLGLWLVRRYRPDAIWSTYPVASAHSIGGTICRLSGLPWVADFRDSMTEPGYPENPLIRQSRLRVESRTVHRADRIIFTAESALEMYARRYPEIDRSRWAVISNGYDEDNFARLEETPTTRTDSRITLVHSGLIDPSDRNPTAFFEAIAQLKDSGQVSSEDVCINLRATGSNAHYLETVSQMGIDDIVRFTEMVPYNTALQEMLSADGLILFQGENCNHQIPAKAYEYFRAGRPVLGFADPAGDTGRLLHSAGVRHIAALEDRAEVARVLSAFITEIRNQSASGVDPATARRYSRRSLTKNLADVLNVVSRNTS